jgi:hypothetical protein
MLLAGAHDGLSLYSRRGDWQQPASRRLAFRELGLAVGFFAIELIQRPGRGKTISSRGAPVQGLASRPWRPT